MAITTIGGFACVVFLHCGKKKVYELARAGQIDMVKLGHSTRVTEASLRKLIGELPRRGPAEK